MLGGGLDAKRLKLDARRVTETDAAIVGLWMPSA
jgi:hypothetical protein